MLKVRARRPQNERCVYCHGEENVPDSGLEMVDCLTCRTAMHIECRAEAKRCATRGCGWRTEETIDYMAALGPPDRRLSHRMAGVLIYGFIALLFGALFCLVVWR